MATIGPSIHDADMLTSMLEAGMSGGRVDLTWGEWAPIVMFLRRTSMWSRRIPTSVRRMPTTVIGQMVVPVCFHDPTCLLAHSIRRQSGLILQFECVNFIEFEPSSTTTPWLQFR
jgi:hypothetical protein